jgi:hypothetical protein
MKRLCNILFLLQVFFLAVPVFPEETKITGLHAEAKELKIAAHRSHIPVEQLKNARRALQEATDLFMISSPDQYAGSRVLFLYTFWQQMSPSRANEIADEFIRKLRSEAVKATKPSVYQQAAENAVSLMRFFTESDFEKMQAFIRSWPAPPAGTAVPADFLKNMESKERENTFWKVVKSDPQKALTFLSGDPEKYDYLFSWAIAEGFMNAGKKEEADRLINRIIKNFTESTGDKDAIREYKNFLWRASSALDNDHANAAINALFAMFAKQGNPVGCSGTLKIFDATIDLTCIESEVLDIVRYFHERPEFLIRTLDSFPSLKSKLAGFGGIDSIYQSRSKPSLAITKDGSTETRFEPREPDVPEDSEKLLKELSGEVKSNPEYVKRRLREAAKKSGIEILIGMAWTKPNRNDIVGADDLAVMALETARQLNSEITSPRDRQDYFIIRAYRQLEGTVDHELFKNGFQLVDQLKKEKLKPNPAQPVEIGSGCGFTSAECLESRLVHELAKDSFKEAMAHAHSIKNKDFKFYCLLTIVGALSYPNF